MKELNTALFYFPLDKANLNDDQILSCMDKDDTFENEVLRLDLEKAINISKGIEKDEEMIEDIFVILQEDSKFLLQELEEKLPKNYVKDVSNLWKVIKCANYMKENEDYRYVLPCFLVVTDISARLKLLDESEKLLEVEKECLKRKIIKKSYKEMFNFYRQIED